VKSWHPVRKSQSPGGAIVAMILSPALCLLVVGAASAELATVKSVDGRTLTAEIDGRSDDTVLWLRFDRGPTTIRRSVAWANIASARVGDAEIDVDELRRRAAVASQAQASADDSSSSPAPSSPRAGTLRTWHIAGRSTDASTSSPVVRSLYIDGSLRNWDADVEADGIVLSFAALDELGAPVPVDGTLEVELIGERLPPYSRGNAFPVLARWTRSVAAGADGGGYYSARLEFQASHPDFELHLPRYAMLHARLMVPGQGTFEASLDGVSLRGFTPVRDRIEAASGTRWLPTERTGRSKGLASRSVQ